MAEVVLVHGLWYRSWALVRLRERLSAEGFSVRAFSYPTLGRELRENAADLLEFSRSGGAATIHFVGHSLGGLVILSLLGMEHLLPVGRVVFLGTPLKGSMVATRLVRSALGRRVLGDAGPALAAGADSLPKGIPCGMIAGTLAHGLGRLTGPFRGANDGTVLTSETVAAGLADRVELEVSHTGMLFSFEAASQVACFLRDGRFSHPAEAPRNVPN